MIPTPRESLDTDLTKDSHETNNTGESRFTRVMTPAPPNLGMTSSELSKMGENSLIGAYKDSPVGKRQIDVTGNDIIDPEKARHLEKLAKRNRALARRKKLVEQNQKTFLWRLSVIVLVLVAVGLIVGSIALLLTSS